MRWSLFLYVLFGRRCILRLGGTLLGGEGSRFFWRVGFSRWVSGVRMEEGALKEDCNLRVYLSLVQLYIP